MISSLNIRPVFNILCLLTSFISSGQVQKPISIKEKVLSNGKLFQVNIDKDFLEIDPLMKEAVEAGDSLSELKLLERKRLYYYNKHFSLKR